MGNITPENLTTGARTPRPVATKRTPAKRIRGRLADKSAPQRAGTALVKARSKPVSLKPKRQTPAAIAPLVDPALEFRFGVSPRTPISAPLALLPIRDCNQAPHGRAYRPFERARKPRFSTRATTNALHNDRRHELLSLGEYRVLVVLQFHPWVRDIREQYPMLDHEKFWKALDQGKRMRRSDILTIDFIVTYQLPHSTELRYHGISIKSARYAPDDKDKAREDKERACLTSIGWTWELVKSDAVSDREYQNCALLYNYVRDTDIMQLRDAARQFAAALKKGSRSGVLGAVLSRLGRNMHLDELQTHRLFASAVAFGYLELDHEYGLGMDRELMLKSVDAAIRLAGD